MPDVSYDLLREPHFRVTDANGAEARVSLAGALARLSAGSPTEFAGLRSHQIHPWFAFIVQVAALAARRAGSDGRGLPTDEETWTAWLLDLSGGAPEAWCLVVSDLAKPAFLQPPVPEGTIKEFKPVDTPDQIDVLITAKNHEKKRARMSRATAEHWAFALVSQQTSDGYPGAGNYGVAKMNSGSGSRPVVGVAKGETLADRFGRDVRVWLESHDDIAERFGYARDGGVALAWCVAWDGETALPLQELDPCFVDCCRRLRLTRGSNGVVSAKKKSSKGLRVDAGDLKGVLGDIWIPTKLEDPPSALTVAETGFTYTLTQSLLPYSDAFRVSASTELRDEDGDAPVFIARVLARGQSKTSGLHERVVPIPPRVKSLLATPDAKAQLRARSRFQVDTAGNVRRDGLRQALLSLVQGGPDKVNQDDRRADRVSLWTSQFEHGVDAMFFDALWSNAERSKEDADRDWQKRVGELARAVLREAVASAPVATMRRYRAEAKANQILTRALYKHCPLYLTNDPTTPEAST